MGGFITVNDEIKAWFACDFTSYEVQLLKIQIGDCSCQQTVEALAALVGIRAWSSFWLQEGAALRLKSDSTSALTMAIKLKSAGHGARIVARELALDLAKCSWPPIVAEHVPGAANQICDLLSRWYQPGHSVALPEALKNVQRTKFKSRDRDYYKSVIPPASRQGGRKRDTEQTSWGKAWLRFRKPAVKTISTSSGTIDVTTPRHPSY